MSSHELEALYGCLAAAVRSEYEAYDILYTKHPVVSTQNLLALSIPLVSISERVDVQGA